MPATAAFDSVQHTHTHTHTCTASSGTSLVVRFLVRFVGSPRLSQLLRQWPRPAQMVHKCATPPPRWQTNLRCCMEIKQQEQDRQPVDSSNSVCAALSSNHVCGITTNRTVLRNLVQPIPCFASQYVLINTCMCMFCGLPCTRRPLYFTTGSSFFYFSNTILGGHRTKLKLCCMFEREQDLKMVVQNLSVPHSLPETIFREF